MRTEIDMKITAERYTRASAPATEQHGQTVISHLCQQCSEFRGRISKLEQELAMLQSAQESALRHATGLPPIER